MLRRIGLIFTLVTGIAASAPWIAKLVGYTFNFVEISHLLTLAHDMTVKVLQHVGSLYDTVMYMIVYPVGAVICLAVAIAVAWRMLGLPIVKSFNHRSSDGNAPPSSITQSKPNAQATAEHSRGHSVRDETVKIVNIYLPIFVMSKDPMDENSGSASDQPRRSRGLLPMLNQGQDAYLADQVLDEHYARPRETTPSRIIGGRGQSASQQRRRRNGITGSKM